MLTTKSLSTSSVKLKARSKTQAVDHARMDVWFLNHIKMHALDTKWEPP